MKPPLPSENSNTRFPTVGAALYVGLLLAGFGGFWAIRWLGEQLPASTGETAAAVTGSPATGQVDVVFHVLATLAAVIALGRVLSVLLKLVGQPAVIGEVVAGIVLGPSVLGTVFPEAMEFFIPGHDVDPSGKVIASLQTIAQLGIVLYMFLVGLELNTTLVAQQAQTAIAIAHASIAVPFVMGAGLSLWLFPRLAPPGVPFTSFALFVGVALAITAFPVLARILADFGLEKCDLGVLALTTAATADVTAWCLLALVVGISQAQVGSSLMMLAGSAAFIAGVFVIVKPAAVAVANWFERHPHDAVARPGLFVAVLLAALVTERLGIHAVFGAFLLGVIIPHDSRVAKELSRQLHAVVMILLLPGFFAVTGINTRIGLIQGAESWLMCGAIIVVATLGKWGGTMFAARLAGSDWRQASALGALMNTRGLMEVILLNIGLSLGVISPTLFAMMVLMALVTTATTSPVLKWLLPANEMTATRAPVQTVAADPPEVAPTLNI